MDYLLAIDDAAVHGWMDAYRSAWIERDPDKAAMLFAYDAQYQERRYKPALVGVEAIRNYWRVTVQKQQRDVNFGYELVALRGQDAFVHWRADYTWLPINGIIELDALTRVRFAAERAADGMLLAAQWDEWIDSREA